MTTPHPYAEILRAIADGKTIQAKKSLTDAYVDVDPVAALRLMAVFGPETAALRIKPVTIRIGEFDVPEPLRSAPESGTTFYVVMPSVGNVAQKEWPATPSDKCFDWLENGFVHLKKEAAELQLKAILSLTRYKSVLDDAGYDL